MITTLLLDVDGVLLFSRPGFHAAIERSYPWRNGNLAFERELMSDPAEARTLVGDGDLLTLVRRILPRHVAGLAAIEFVDRWIPEAIEPNNELLDMIPAIGVRQVYLATNQEPVRGAYIAGLYADRPWLTGTLMSYELGHRKPDPEYFTQALSRVDRAPEECLFVDDQEACVDTARDVGIPSIQFRSNSQLATDLATRGLLANG